MKNKKIVESENLKSVKLKSKKIDNKDKPLLYALLRWRKEKAEELEKDEYQILPTAVVNRIAEEKPMSIKDLKSISKLGTTRIKSFGADIINMVLESQGFKKCEFEDEESNKEMNLSSSVMKTLNLLDEDYSIDDIAKERGLAKSTIEGHIVEIVKNGFYSAEDFVSQEHYQIINEYFEETGDNSLTAARDVLGDDFTFFELKMCLLSKKIETPL
jgi:ATP-dependent DNA helicase RecQ